LLRETKPFSPQKAHEPPEENMTMRLTLFTLFVNDQDQALRFYVDQLGFVMREDKRLGDYRWLLVSAQQSKDEVSINLELARTPEQQALVGKQGGGKPVFALATENCDRDVRALKARGVTFDGEPRTMPYGTGVTLNDLYGNKIYLNEDPR
jgi:predicted enzyme related to lactoylglutathione lyase